MPHPDKKTLTAWRAQQRQAENQRLWEKHKSQSPKASIPAKVGSTYKSTTRTENVKKKGYCCVS